ncbi:MAG: hypothetical protein IPK16_18345 [Anaerolineales bacterium]|nr:hypothetical protein [Anaerolineales bacterium]
MFINPLLNGSLGEMQVTPAQYKPPAIRIRVDILMSVLPGTIDTERPARSR